MAFSAIRTLALTIGLVTVTLGQTLPRCVAMYRVMPGDMCQMIVDRHPNTLTMDELKAWNPMVNAGCTNLMPDMNLCIRQISANDCLRT